MKTAVSKLSRLGFSDYEARAYISLLRENPLTAYEISKNSGIPSSKVYEVIKKLEAKQIVQSIHGERSRMFIPTAPDEFIESVRTNMEENLSSARAELTELSAAKVQTGYTLNIHEYDALISKARRILDTCRESALLSVWPEEIQTLQKPLGEAENRGVKLAILCHGAMTVKFGQMYRHPVENTRFVKDGRRGFTLVADSKEALLGKIDNRSTEATWSMNEGFVMMAEDYIRHDIYVMKIVGRFDPLLKEKFGPKYEKLIDVHTDEDMKK